MPVKNKINLLPKTDFESSFAGKLVDWAINVGRWIVVLTEFVVICAFLSRFYFDTQLANLFDLIRQNKAIVGSALSFEENFRATQDKLKIAKEILANQEKATTIIVQISKLLPIETTLTDISVDKENLKISGYSLSEKSIELFLAGLTKNQKFYDVSLGKIVKNQETVAINFVITAKIKNGQNLK